MYRIIRKILFCFDAEKVHSWVMKQLKIVYSNKTSRRLLKKAYTLNNSSLEQKLWGLTFPNPIGLAGGFDKNAEYTDPLSCLGFGFIEIGTVTPVEQSGNPQPRLFRLPKDKALLNRMGFNNKGAEFAANQLKNRKEKVLIAGNIGKNKLTPNDDAIKDYELCFNILYEWVDFFIVNVSSPNTPGLRALQAKDPLMALLTNLKELNALQKQEKPILLKIAPDLTNEQLDDIIVIVETTRIDGIVATNTTVSRSNLNTSKQELERNGSGGISGMPVQKRSTEVIRYLYEKTKGCIPIIACGGIFNASDAIEKLNAGASLVQVYTGFIYEGPLIVKNIAKGLIKNKNM